MERPKKKEFAEVKKVTVLIALILLAVVISACASPPVNFLPPGFQLTVTHIGDDCSVCLSKTERDWRAVPVFCYHYFMPSGKSCLPK